MADEQNFVEDLKNLFNKIKESESRIVSLAEENRRLSSENAGLRKEKEASEKALTEELKKLFYSLNEHKKINRELLDENGSLKKSAQDRTIQILNAQKKVEDVTKILAQGDKIIEELKLELSEKNQDIDFLNKRIKFLESAETEKLVGIREQFERASSENISLKSELNRLNFALKNADSSRTLLEDLKKRNFALEEANRRLLRQKASDVKPTYEGSRIFYGEQKLREDLNRSFSTRISPGGRGSVAVAHSVILDSKFDAELGDIRAMIKLALEHGDSIPAIKDSLINTGYRKEKIEKALSLIK